MNNLYGVITASADSLISVHAQPCITSPIYAAMRDGDEVELDLEFEGKDWIKIVTEVGIEGFVPRRNVIVK